MFRSRGRLGALLVIGLLTLACDSPPDKEMHQAQGALEAARAAGAAEYAAVEFKAAEASLQRSQAAVAERDYRQALSSALDARERAGEAAKLAAENRARARSEIDQLLTNARAAFERAEAALAAAAEARVPAPQLAASRATLASARATIDTAAAAIEAGDYAGARHQAEGVAPTLDRIRSEIDAAAQARASRRPVRRGGR